MKSFEQDFKAFLREAAIKYTDNCDSYDRLDFTLNNFSDGKDFYIDVKEKRQKINTKNWPSVIANEEKNIFIIDDLAARKIMAHAPYSGVLIRDNLTEIYHWYSVIDLGLMPKTRVNRAIEKNTLQYKGKWIIDFRNSLSKTSLSDILASIKAYCHEVVSICTEILPCYGEYETELIKTEGGVRKPGHWDTDVSETR